MNEAGCWWSRSWVRHLRLRTRQAWCVLWHDLHVCIYVWQKYPNFWSSCKSFHPQGRGPAVGQFVTPKSSFLPNGDLWLFGSFGFQFWKHHGEPSVQAPSCLQDPSFGCCLNPIHAGCCEWRVTRKSLVALSVMETRSPPWDLQDLSASCQVTWEGKCL